MSGTILFVDDLATQRAAASFTLTSAGYNVISAENGQDALAKLENAGEIQLIITDLTMPIIDGVSLLKMLKQDPVHRQIPILMLLQESQISQKEQLRAAGAVGWILKPFQPEQLCTVVSKLVP
ncbi:response regulator [Deltaproteobacteria bacterium TL4]